MERRFPATFSFQTTHERLRQMRIEELWILANVMLRPHTHHTIVSCRCHPTRNTDSPCFKTVQSYLAKVSDSRLVYEGDISECEPLHALNTNRLKELAEKVCPRLRDSACWRSGEFTQLLGETFLANSVHAHHFTVVVNAKLPMSKSRSLNNQKGPPRNFRKSL